MRAFSSRLRFPATMIFHTYDFSSDCARSLPSLPCVQLFFIPLFIKMFNIAAKGTEQKKKTIIATAKSQNCIQEEKIGYRRWGTEIRTHNSVYSKLVNAECFPHRKGTTFFHPVPQIHPYWECVRRCQNIARIRLVALDGAWMWCSHISRCRRRSLCSVDIR